MPSLMSFSLTLDQMYSTFGLPPVNGPTKCVTRRWNAWHNLKAGDELWAVEKAMGLGRGDKIVRIGRIVVTETRWEPLRRMIDDRPYGLAEVVNEGFPEMTPEAFVEMLCKHGHHRAEEQIHRIGFVPYETIQPRLF